MTNQQPQPGHEVVIIGLGIIGRNLLLNMADHGFPLAVGDPNSLGSENTVGVTRIGG
jgi:6-phosphogluconate dehydrogenase